MDFDDFTHKTAILLKQRENLPLFQGGDGTRRPSPTGLRLNQKHLKQAYLIGGAAVGMSHEALLQLTKELTSQLLSPEWAAGGILSDYANVAPEHRDASALHGAARFFSAAEMICSAEDGDLKFKELLTKQLSVHPWCKGAEGHDAILSAAMSIDG